MGRKKHIDPAISLIIPVRGRERLLNATITNALARRGVDFDIEVIVCDSGYVGPAVENIGRGVIRTIDCRANPGTGPARHSGVMASKAPICVTIDSHVLLCEDWAFHIFAAHMNKIYADIYCGHMGILDPDTFKPVGDVTYHGADLWWYDPDSSDFRPLVGKWHRDADLTGERTSLMGAFYVFSRQRYIDLGSPWRLFRSWGCDEEVLSIANILAGGKIKMLPQNCFVHHGAHPDDAIKYPPSDLADVARNRTRLSWLFPFTPAERAHLRARSYTPTEEELEFAEIYENKRPELEELIAKLKGTPPASHMEPPKERPVSAAMLRQPILGSIPTPPRPPQRLPPPAQVTCDQCDSINSFTVVYTDGEVTHLKCKRCGRKAYRMRDKKITQGIYNF